MGEKQRLLVVVAVVCGIVALAACGSSPHGWSTATPPDASQEPTDGGLSNDALLFPEAQPGGPDVPSLDFASETYGPMQYLGGPVLNQPVDIYLLWYGSWKPGVEDADRQALLTHFLTELSGSPWLSIESDMETDPWDGGPRTPPTNQLRVIGSVDVPYGPAGDSSATDLTNDKLLALVAANTVADMNAVYVVIPSNDVTYDSYNACEFFCAFHDSFVPPTDGGASAPLRYVFLPDYEPYAPADGGVVDYTCQSGCTIQSYSTNYGVFGAPHGADWSIDGMANALAHELAESIDDPDPNINPAWQDVVNGGLESADKCEWRFDPAVWLPGPFGGAYANVQLQGEWWLLQQNWRNEVTGPWGGECVLAPPVP